jgi:hypothetical protein
VGVPWVGVRGLGRCVRMDAGSREREAVGAWAKKRGIWVFGSLGWLGGVRGWAPRPFGWVLR